LPNHVLANDKHRNFGRFVNLRVVHWQLDNLLVVDNDCNLGPRHEWSFVFNGKEVPFLRTELPYRYPVAFNSYKDYI
jgi:hypothetical protein